MKVVLLAGGLGSRLAELTEVIPKPMVEIGGKPLLWHIMKIYSAYGFKDFVVALGYKGDMIKEYFLNYRQRYTDLRISLKGGQVEYESDSQEDWTIQLVDTGLGTGTGGRIKRLASRIAGETFMMTYGDGVGNINIGDLVALHRKQGGLATITAVRPPARFGELTLDEDRVAAFNEKPQVGEGWINGGFMVLEPGMLDYIEGDETMFEREPLERLARDGQLAAYRHHDFWQGADTLRDIRFLQSLWEEGNAPWATRRTG